MRAWALAVLVGGCGFQSSAGPKPPGGDAGDIPVDAPVEMAPDGMAPTNHVCLGTFVKVCADVPVSALTLMTGTIDTADASAASKCLGAGTYTTEPAVDACVIAGRTIAIPDANTVTATGTRRLILMATESIQITGTLDAASRHGKPSGPAADAGPCPTNFRDPTSVVEGGGGWGGTFGLQGNNGGNTPGGGIGGGAGSGLQIKALAGGCPGGKGGNNGGGNGGGAGGHGGGAVLLLAGQSVLIDGTVNASGSGGNGGNARGGGGGGGAGGMIALDAPMLRIPGKCFANGGGGGEGSSVVAGGAGGESSAPDKEAAGGTSISVGGDGGRGGIATSGSRQGDNGATVGNPPLQDTGGGGAGGGGVGIIKIFSADPGKTDDPKKVSPPPS